MRVKDTVLPSTHKSADTAYVINDYPCGRRLRCFKRMWVEYRKGYGQRVCFQTTKPIVNKNKDDYAKAPMDRPGLWCAVKKGGYSQAVIMYIDESTGYVEVAGVHSQAWLNHLSTYARRFGSQLDIWQRIRFGWTYSAITLVAIRKRWEEQQQRVA